MKKLLALSYEPLAASDYIFEILILNLTLLDTRIRRGVSKLLQMYKLSLLRKAGISEGISFLVLLLIAMPLKYFFQQPMAVKIVGWMHGLLFVTFIGMAWAYKDERNKPFKWFALAVVAALVPLGTFWFDKSLQKEEPRSQDANPRARRGQRINTKEN